MDLTAVIPCKDRDVNIALCLGSIDACRPRPRAVLVDYGSVNDLRPYSGRYPWLRVVRVEGGGMFNKARAMNVGLSKVETRFVLATDVDQVFAPEFFGTVGGVLERRPWSLVLCWTHYVNEVPKWLTPGSVGKRYWDLLNEAKKVGKFYGEGCCNGLPTNLARMVRGWDEDYVGFGAEDSDFMLRVVRCGLTRRYVHGKTSMIHLPHPKVGAYYSKERCFYPNRARYKEREAGDAVVVNLTRRFNPPGPSGGPPIVGLNQAPVMDAVERAGRPGVNFQSAMLERAGRPLWKTLRNVLDAAAQVGEGWLVFGKDDCPGKEFLAELRSKVPGFKVLLRYGDFRAGLPEEVGALSGLLDAVMVTHEDRGAMERIMRAGVPAVGTYYGSRPSFGPRPGGRPRDILFFGQNSGEGKYPLSGHRLDLVGAFSATFGSRFTAMGRGWTGACSHAPVGFGKLGAEVSAAKVVLGTNHFDAVRYYTTRLVQTLAAGSFHLTRYIPGMERDFGNHVHLAWYRNIDEALDLAGWYLRHDEERERVAAAGTERAKKMFSYDADAKRLLAFVDKEDKR
jgi:hypothetical protein